MVCIKIKKKIYFVLAWIALCTKTSAQNIFTLSGTIKSEETRQVIVGASLKILNSNREVLTNDCGFYSIIPPASRFHLEVSASGKKTKIITIGLFRDQQLDINLREDTGTTRKTKLPVDSNYERLREETLPSNKQHRIIIEKYLRRSLKMATLNYLVNHPHRPKVYGGNSIAK